MRIEVLVIEGCPNSPVAVAAVHEALQTLGRAGDEVVERLITSPADAAETAFAGSPTVLVNGVDAVPGATPSDSLACRVYTSAAGLTGSPTVAQLIDAIRSQE